MVNKNRLANVKNHYQGKDKKVLCLCSAGLLRSPTAANVLHREFGFNTRAAGLSQEYALIPVDEALLTWADEIVCMELQQLEEVTKLLDDAGLDRDVFSLDIPDNYPYMDETLQNLIKKAYLDIEIFMETA